ncbi:universal stress protein [Paenibacillus terrigena]|uniref:universal stress protein n=1 Tax=Paenibacillus terrigena TaxID=369333 RepID=UPI00035C3AA9|nr:universal stress protein [Paenibacillus terrigena]
MEQFRRKTPEEILESITRLSRGYLKILIGAVSGSGKTYHLLREGHQLARQGVDVVITAISTRQRPETMEQIGDLERVPSIHWMKDGVEQKDIDLGALIQRNPEAVLIDGLAHRNRPGALHATRLEDIQYLLKQGISVTTTVNVYELQEVAELAEPYIGFKPEITVPTDTLEMADEVRLIDVTPETLLKRMAEGHLDGLQLPADVSVFRHGNLAVLRELALRLVAEGVNDSLERHRERLGLIGPSWAAERILVAAQYHWNGSIYIRRGQQIAKRLNGDLRVVTFVKPGMELTKESATFKRSIVKLTEKIDAPFEELPLPSQRHLPRILMDYALEHQVTRIVIGHSKMTRWQELLKGSVLNGLIARMNQVDMFIVADRAESDGERILPTKRLALRGDVDIAGVPSGEEKMLHGKVRVRGQLGDLENNRYRRLTQEEIDREVESIQRGHFKVYIGAAPGVGKTYTMLREGNELLRKGMDLCIGYLETHGRRETAGQVGALPLVPRRKIDYRGVQMEEMDTDEILRQNPEVVLVDELAHTNVPGSELKKRYEDVERLLAAGISVISTMNVQHLESLNDAVEQITGVRVRETVPDHILRLADEVELIDVAPKTLQQRLRDGHIYRKEQVEQSLNHFFKTGNLIALRELALRELADDVDERLESWERKPSLRGPWRRKEVIFVGVTLSSNAERLIRRGFRIAYRLKAALYVTYIHTGGPLTAEQQERADAIGALTERFGGTFKVSHAPHARKMADIFMQEANLVKSTQLILGQSARPWHVRLLRGSVINKLLRMARHMDVLIVAKPKG